jgi:hypothetical protein
MDDDLDDDDDAGPALLIELAPFTTEFYVALTALVNEAYRPTTTPSTALNETTNKNSDSECDDDDGNLISSSAAVTATAAQVGMIVDSK